MINGVAHLGCFFTVYGLLRKPEDSGSHLGGSCFSGRAAPADVDAIPGPLRQQLDAKVSALPHGSGHMYGFVGIDGSLEGT